MGRRRPPLPREPHRARIEGLDGQARGVATVGSRRVHIPGALPGELVEFRYARRARRSDDGRIERVLEAAPERVPAGCAHFDVCGGCRSQHVAPARQVARAQAALLSSLAACGVAPERVEPPLLGPQWGYRRRARLGVRRVAKKGVLVGFREKTGNLLAEVSACAVLEPVVGREIGRLRVLVGGLEVAGAIPQIEVAVGDHAAALVFRHLAPPSRADLEALRRFGAEAGLQICLQSGGPDSVRGLDGEPPSELEYRLDAYGLTLRFLPTDFVQVNAEVNRKLVEQAHRWVRPRPGERVLDLFCGLGNFSLPLAHGDASVLGVDGASGLIERARDNAERNRLSSVVFEARDLNTAQAVERCLAWAPDKLLLDPPRSGAEVVSRALVARGREGPGRVVYVSCGQESFVRDAALLAGGGYVLATVGVVDMFPHTGHIETIARFERR